MRHTFTALFAHIIFCTHERRPSLTPAIRPRLHGYIAGIVRNVKASTLAVGGYDDHVHLLAELPPDLTISDLVRDVKANSSRWMKETARCRFAWQRGYAAFSVSKSNVPVVARYIERQEEHHRRRNTAEELHELFRLHGVVVEDRPGSCA